jgi:hypothetical protein
MLSYPQKNFFSVACRKKIPLIDLYKWLNNSGIFVVAMTIVPIVIVSFLLDVYYRRTIFNSKITRALVRKILILI